MSVRRRLCAFALVAAMVGAASPHLVLADETSPANVAAARRHFDKAKADYARGAYREAIGELEAAHTLDPNAKDLVFNLGVVHEKLGDIDDALKWFRLYITMNLTPAERDRADAYIRRLGGAQKEIESKQADAAPSATVEPPPPPPAETPSNGRIDAFTIVGASLSVVALGVGVGMAVKAESDKPPANFVTGRNGTWDNLQNRTSQAHSEAVAADVCFGAAIAFAAATTYLYFSRPKAGAPPSTGSGGQVSVSAAPATGGGAFFVQGSF